MNISPPERRDIFDRILSLPLLRRLYPFYRKHREGLLYLFFGAVTTVVSWVSFYFFCYPLGMGELIANVLSWILAVLVAFLTNRIWVFSEAVTGRDGFFLQMLLFFGSRVATLAVEEVILLIFVTWLAFDAMIVKIIGNLIVLLLNYILSKIFVFHTKKDPTGRVCSGGTDTTEEKP